VARHEKMEEFEAGPGVEFGALVAEEGARYSLPVDVADEKLEPRGIAMVEAWSLPAPTRRGEDEFKIRDLCKSRKLRGTPISRTQFDSFYQCFVCFLGVFLAAEILGGSRRLAPPHRLARSVMSVEERLELFRE